ncbi:hypothetical protein NDU88_002294 [Pleurodeles waltl]|uniref:Dystrophin n=1 Tax=Pleurodeles waltl TaxID=8319 RepID=A0AAV7UVQ5_PLEWA|nr:hypothetical protein NDU88_002294 [Pleurodeles waltl]
MARELQKTEKELSEAECGVASGTMKREDLGVIREKWTEVDSLLRQLLAWLLKGEQQRTPIGAIRLDTGAIVNTQAEINKALKRYYSALYMALPPLHQNKWRIF